MSENTAFAPLFHLGNPNDAFAQYFSGNSYLQPLAPAVANVTFEPGCRNNWHIHHASKGGGQSCCAPMARAGIRNGESPHRRSGPETR